MLCNNIMGNHSNLYFSLLETSDSLYVLDYCSKGNARIKKTRHKYHLLWSGQLAAPRMQWQEKPFKLAWVVFPLSKLRSSSTPSPCLHGPCI